MTILDQYTASGPNLQNTIDLFKGEWSSKFPDRYGIEAGAAPLFEDARIQWAAEQFGGFEGKTVLELGPLEAGHTYMMEQFGASSITAVEANSRSFLKCLIVKEVLDLKRSHFVYSDCIEFLKSSSAQYDICIASGILYHMVNPAELIARASQVSQKLFVWTHYYDPAVITGEPRFAVKFPSTEEREYDGFRHTLHRYEYQAALGWSGFCGGSAPHSNWMSREDILNCCKHFGFSEIHINFDHQDHPNGPCFAFVAIKNGGAATDTQEQSAVADRSPETAPMLTSLNVKAAAGEPAPDRLQKRITNLQRKNQNLEQALQDAQSRIAAMQTSKFWQLREGWFRIKRSLGLPATE
ncbi:class I SAM-dependent methyltransferase [Leptolyngbya ohadii]|uniref:class I SAM-dependent methyltransferase n=1 Tax=Leptolyngbya ohadii TaxID=1962290 RepID=UPI0015C5F12C|nr:class I SAM-dependent methyltransferase [Leptolyngbya ohadii]